jgi:branched-chain amino acid transport system ATP-binding protein
MLSISNVDIYYGDIQVIHNLSLRVEEGEIYALFGRNGAGKSTLIKSCVGIVPVKAGNIIFNDRDITNMEPYKICSQGIGFTFQERCVFPMLSVKEHLALAEASAYSRRNLKEICNEALDLFPDIEPHLNDKAATLSGGEAQMVKLAMAIVRRPKPKLLFVDEPSTGLSPDNVHRFTTKLRQLKGETTIIIVEQVIGAAIKIADSYAVIRDGMIIHQDRVHDIDKDEEVVQEYILG